MKKYRIKRIIIISVTIIILIVSYILYNKFYLKTDSNNQTLEELTKETSTKTNKEDDIFVVEIKGSVYYPGLYTFTKDIVIVNDVIEMAGGLTRRADIDKINLSEVVENHSLIYIGSVEADSYILKEDEKLKLININTCSKEDLMTLPGIGEAKALAILQYREDNGYFYSIEGLKKVSGIGENLYNKIKGYITV